MKVEIKRDQDPGSDYPHGLLIRGAFFEWLNTVQADALEAALIPDQSDLPEGFRRWPDGTILARGDAWNRERESGEWERRYGYGWATVGVVSGHVYYEVRRTQRTELVPWYEAKDRTLPDGQEVGLVEWGDLGPQVWPKVGGRVIPNADGMVEVLK